MDGVTRRGFCARCGKPNDDSDRYVVRVFSQQRTVTGSSATRSSAQVSVCGECSEILFNEASSAIERALRERSY